MGIFQYCVLLQSRGWAAGSPTCTVYVEVTLTRSKVKVKVTWLLNFRQLAKPCTLAAMTTAPLRGFLVFICFNKFILLKEILCYVCSHAPRPTGAVTIHILHIYVCTAITAHKFIFITQVNHSGF